MTNKLENILTFSILLWQILREYDRSISSIKLGEVNNDYIIEKSEFYLGIKISHDQLNIDRFRNLSLSKLKELFEYFDQNFGMDNISDIDMTNKLKGDFGKYLYPNNIIDHLYEHGYHIKGLHVNLSNFILNLLYEHIENSEQWTHIHRKYTLDNLLKL